MGNDVKKSRTNHAPALKAKVALEAVHEAKAITKSSREYDVHVNLHTQAWHASAT